MANTNQIFREVGDTNPRTEWKGDKGRIASGKAVENFVSSRNHAPQQSTLVGAEVSFSRHIRESVLFLLAYVGLDWVSAYSMPMPEVHSWYPAAGLGLAFLLRYGPSYAPLLFLAELLIYWGTRHHWQGAPTWLVFALALQSAWIYGVSTWWLRRWRNISWNAPRIPKLAAFLLAAGLIALAHAFACAWLLTLAGGEAQSDFAMMVFRWGMGDALGIFMLTPLLLAYEASVPAWLSSLGTAKWRQNAEALLAYTRKLDIYQITEAIAFLATCIMAAWLTFGQTQFIHTHYHYYPVFAPVIWAVIRYGWKISTVVTFGVNVGGALAHLYFHIPLTELMSMQLFLLVLSGICLLTGALTSERLEAENKFRQQRNFTADILDAAGALVVVLDKEQRILRFNRACRETTGYAFEEIKGRDFLEALLLPKDRAVVSNILASEQTRDMETIWRTKDGTQRVVSWSHTTSADIRGRMKYDIIAGFDVTARRQAVETRLLLGNIVESSDDAIIAVTLDGIVTTWNAGAEHIYGYSAKEMIGNSITTTAPETRVHETPAILSKIRVGERVEHFETERLRKDGRLFHVSLTISPVKDLHGSITGASVIARDIDRRKRAEEEQKRLATILEATPDLLAIVNPDGQLVFANRALHEVHGKASVGDSIYEYFTKSSRAFLKNVAFPTAARSSSWKGELEFLRADGSLLPVSQVILAHTGESGELEFFSTIMRDISDRKRLEEQFRQAQKLEAVGRLAGGVAHDFNNMLGVIIGYTQLLQEKIGTETGVQDKLAEVKRAADRAAALTRQLLAFSRKQVLQPRGLDVNSVVADLAKMLRRMIGDDIHLAISPDPSLWKIMADPGQLEQVLMNLAVNARDAMPDGGELLIETRNVKLDEVYSQQHRPVVPGEYVMLAVCDTGCGMSAETQAHIFEPFFTTKGEGKGTGLGLSTVYGVIKQSGGYIWVYSELELGTTFKIYFPRLKREQGVLHEEPTLSAPSPNFFPITILLVEDEDSMRQLVRGLLISNGYTVLDASNGADALKIAQQYPEKIHLLLTDVIMPGMSGSELVKRMRVVRPGLHVLYMSGYTDDMIAHQGILESGLTLLEKPFSKEALMTKVNEALDKVPLAAQ